MTLPEPLPTAPKRSLWPALSTIAAAGPAASASFASRGSGFIPSAPPKTAGRAHDFGLRWSWSRSF